MVGNGVYMEIYLNHPEGGNSDLSRSRIIGITEWQQIMHEGLPTVTISTPDSSGLQKSEHLLRGNVRWGKRRCCDEEICEESINQIGAKSDAVIILESEDNTKPKKIIEALDEKTIRRDDFYIIRMDDEKTLSEDTPLPILRSREQKEGAETASFSADPPSPYKLVGEGNPDIVEFIDDTVKGLISEDVIEEYADMRLDYLKILHLRDIINSELTCSELEYVHQNATEITEILNVESIPDQVIKQSDVDLSTSVEVVGVEQATYCLATAMAKEIEKQSDGINDDTPIVDDAASRTASLD